MHQPGTNPVVISLRVGTKLIGPGPYIFKTNMEKCSMTNSIIDFDALLIPKPSKNAIEVDQAFANMFSMKAAKDEPEDDEFYTDPEAMVEVLDDDWDIYDD
jgi:hypothetical protein